MTAGSVGSDSGVSLLVLGCPYSSMTRPGLRRKGEYGFNMGGSRWRAVRGMSCSVAEAAHNVLV